MIEKIDGSLSGTFGSSSHTSKEWSIQVEPAFSETGERRVTARWFDVQNRITREQIGGTSGSDTETHLFRYDQNGQKLSLTDPRGRVTTYEYDLRNRLKRTIEPLNRITENTYDTAGNKTLVEFPDETTQQWPAYDPFGQPRQFIDERGNTTYLDYWPWGPMKILAKVTTKRTKDDTQPEYQLTEFLPDQMGRPRRTNLPDGSFELADYGCGQVKTWTTRRSQIKRVFYDARGREDYHTWDSGAAAGVDRQWDDANRLTAISNSFSIIDYGYDDAGQAKWEGTTVTAGAGMTPSGRKEVKYCRYPSGGVSQLTYPDGNTVVNRYYTGRGQLSSVGWGWANGSTSYVYWPDGKVNYQARTSHVTTSFGYDDRGIMSLVKHRDDDTGHDLAKREYYWRDHRDRITAWKRGTDNSHNAMEDGRGDRYHYDLEGQLDIADYRAEHPDTTADNPSRRDYFYYDELGNRKGTNQVASRGSVNFTRRNNKVNQYLNWTPSVIYYDDNHPNQPGVPPVWIFPGNGVLMADGWITASFNALNQPVAMWCPTYGSNFLWFGYDPLGRCVKRWMGTNMGVPVGVNPTTYFYYDGWNLLQEGPNASTADRLYVHGGRVDEIVASKVAGQWYHHHYDARGHCILLTDGDGAIREQYDYDAFGFPYFYNAAGTSLGTSAQLGNRFLFTGREWLRDLRIYDFRHRQYQPELGRFLQPDPKQFEAGDYNLYRYCHNDPVNFADPDGQVLTVSNPAQRESVLERLKKFVNGNLSIDKEGKISREGNAKDSAYDKDFDTLITSKHTYDIHEERGTAWTPGNYEPRKGGGGDVYFDPKVDMNYRTGIFSQELHTPETLLAHELMRAHAHDNNEPGTSRSDSKADRQGANNRAMMRANRVFGRLNKDERIQYLILTRTSYEGVENWNSPSYGVRRSPNRVLPSSTGNRRTRYEERRSDRTARP